MKVLVVPCYPARGFARVPGCCYRNAGTTGTGAIDASGHAVFTYQGSAAGTDTVDASITNLAGKIQSNDAQVIWAIRAKWCRLKGIIQAWEQAGEMAARVAGGNPGAGPKRAF